MAWLDDVTAHLGQACGFDPAEYAMSEAEAQTLLDLAGVAAHQSGERTNAPLLCFVLGRAWAAGVALADLEQAVRGFAGPA